MSYIKKYKMLILLGTLIIVSLIFKPHYNTVPLNEEQYNYILYKNNLKHLVDYKKLPTPPNVSSNNELAIIKWYSPTSQDNDILSLISSMSWQEALQKIDEEEHN